MPTKKASSTEQLKESAAASSKASKSTAAKKPKAAAKPKGTKTTAKRTAAKQQYKLVIVESPAKAKTIQKYLGKGYQVMASMGHVRDLPKSRLGVDIEHDFAPEYIDIRGKGQLRNELKKMQRDFGITTIYVTHDQEEALTMSDTVVVMDKGRIQQIGTPEDIYNEPKNAFVADFIGESNILDGIMREDYVVETFGRRFQCMDKGFAKDEPVDVVVRPEDIDIVPVKDGMLTGTVTSITFKGMQYDVIVDFKGFKWLIQTTDSPEVGQRIGIRIVPDGFHIMHKSKYSGLYGDYSSFSEEYDELSDAEYDPEAEEESSESREESADEE